ncbi:hypothetical protein LZ554_002430 [Drepanopeziza brunnea f. sp. 'monogermtubi']|nr:hypothetical protein LZ554_002430 [Drepanopeziza brunnea f. sp. 'monogermtubi']
MASTASETTFAQAETTFAQATAVKAASSHTYYADFPGDWCLGPVPHGGFMTAIFLQVAATHFKTTLSSQNQPHTIGLHLDFLRRTQPGAALFTVKDIKLGRQTSNIQIVLTQGGHEEVIASATQGDLVTESGVTFSTDYSLHPLPPPVDLSQLKEDNDEHWARLHEMPFASFRKAATKTQFHFPRKDYESRSLSDQWIRWKNGEKWTNTSLGYVADMFAMPVENYPRKTNPNDPKSQGKAEGPPVKLWYPTVLLNVDVKKALPEEGVEWLFSRTAIKQIKNGRMDLELVVMDEAGEIVALSHHIVLAAAVGSEKIPAKSKTGTSKI